MVGCVGVVTWLGALDFNSIVGLDCCDCEERADSLGELGTTVLDGAREGAGFRDPDAAAPESPLSDRAR